jgi:ParB-like chromosome segregation protein Spo0J
MSGKPGAPESLPIDVLRTGDRVRSGGLNQDHVVILMETVDLWPPILVWGEECLVVDGAHRVEAARRLGRTSVAAIRFPGTRDEAFVESIRRNVDHGLPLTIGDRRRAAQRVLDRHGEWSDRRIASVCGLSGKTVARLRREEYSARSGREGIVVDLPRRVGRDGKTRPIQPGEVRDRIRRALEENPGGSLRTIAALAGASPETVRTVRARLIKDLPDHRRRVAPATGAGCALSVDAVIPFPRNDQDRRNPERSRVRVDEVWISDPALRSCGDGGEFARWFDDSNVDDVWHRYVWTVPVGRIYDIVDEARRRAASWTAFASLLESRTR